jgi:hypothetical protein
MCSKSNVPGVNFGTIRGMSSRLQNTVIQVQTDDLHTARVVTEFLEEVHGQRIVATTKYPGCHWLHLPEGTPVNLSALTVVEWLYGVAIQPVYQT